MKYCKDCGSQIAAKAEICPYCGVRQMNSPKSKTVAGWLGILVGGLGIHKFYMGHNWMGVLYLVFFWTYVPAIVGFIEGVMYLCQSEERFEQRLASNGVIIDV